MVCSWLPWNILDFWLETIQLVSDLVLFEARHVPWFAGGYHGTFWIYAFYKNIEPHSWHLYHGMIWIHVFTLILNQIFDTKWLVRSSYFWSSLSPGASHGLRAATMVRSGFLAWNLSGCFTFGVVWGQAHPMVCGRLPWNVLGLCFLGKHWTTFLTQNHFFLDCCEHLYR